ncbi:MAG: ATP-grasp domain-containing protein [Elusimicrobia bacterium]|nr:ATP-grasp domain-containing protein [Elusimicrobiota bacterium]
MGKVLITGGLERKTLAASRCLAEFGHEVHVGDSSILAPGLWSRYCRKRVLYPSTRYKPDEHLAFLRELLAREKYDFVLPCSEYEVHLYTEHFEELGPLSHFALPPKDKLPYAMDKAKTNEAARRLGVPCPRGWAPLSESELDAALAEIGEMPVVIKPRVASGARGLSIVKDKGLLRQTYLETHARYPWPVMQEYIPSDEGGNVTVVILGKNQEVLTRFSYVRLREFPVAAGASTFVESVARPDQEGFSVKLLQGIGWTGIGMVEFRRDNRDGTPKVIEINERLNASTQLSYLCGVPIPQVLYELYVDGKAKPVLEYRVGVRCRWLIPADILHFIANPDRFRLKPSFFDFFDPATHYEFFDRGDWRPLFFWLLWLMVHAFDPAQWRDFVFRKWSVRK